MHHIDAAGAGTSPVSEKGVQLGPERKGAAESVEAHFRERKRNQGRKGAFMARIGGEGGGGKCRGPVGGAVRIFPKQYPGGGENAPLMTYRSGGGETKGQAAYCSMSELEKVGEKRRSQEIEQWRNRCRRSSPWTRGGVEGAMGLAEIGAPPWMIQGHGIWALQTFVGCVTSNMEDPLWVPRS